MLLEPNEDPFDLGPYDGLMREHQIWDEDESFEATISDLQKHTLQSVQYTVENIQDDIAFWKGELKLFNMAPGGTGLDKPEDFKSLPVADWAKFDSPKWEVLGTESDNQAGAVAKALEGNNDSTALSNTLERADLPWTSDLLHLQRMRTTSLDCVSVIVRLDFEDGPQGEGYNEPAGTYFFARLGEDGRWHPLDLHEPPRGIWCLGGSGPEALILTASGGFVATTDGGASWHDANYGETSFTHGERVETIVANRGAIFAFIDRGSTSQYAPENPLFRLGHYTLLERWRTGLRRILR
jgi:hypothetical protein